MKVDLALEKSCCNNHYVVINDDFYITVREDIWLELAEFVGIDLKENKMDKKQIEEIAKDIKDSLLLHFDKTILYPYLAQDLNNKGYRKITENEVVISKAEYINLKKELKDMEEQRDEQAYITEDLIQEKHRWTYQSRKKMAKEILEYIEQNFSEE